MKVLILFSFLLGSSVAGSQSYFEDADRFFETYVKDGMVDYAGIKKNPQRLNALVEEIAHHNLANKRVTVNYMKAFYINAYNILVIKQVVDLYPIYGPLKVDGFFNGISHVIMGETMTLDELEKGTLNEKFPDPRLHFVLVCAAKGCPPLASFAYQPDDLDTILEQRTKMILNKNEFLRVGKKEVAISQIFDWYKVDFGGTSTSSLSFINQFRDQKISSNSEIKFFDYDWSLNENK